MKNSKITPLLKTIALSIGLVSSLTMAAKADVVYDVVKTVTNTNGQMITTSGDVIRGSVTTSGDVIDSSGRLVGHVATTTVDATGNIIDPSGNIVGHVITIAQPSVAVVPTTTTVVANGTMSDLLATQIDIRRAQIDSQIAAGLAAGNLTYAQAVDLRSELSRITELELSGRASGGGLTFDEGLTLADNLDVLDTRLVAFYPTGLLSPLVMKMNGTTRLVTTTVSSAPVTVLPAAPTQIITSTPNSVTTTTTITQPAVTVPSTVITTVPGTVTVIPATSLTPDLLATTLERRIALLSSYISKGLADGTFTNGQADDMRRDLDRISVSEVKARDQRKLDYKRSVVFARELDHFSERNFGRIVPLTVAPLIANQRLILYTNQAVAVDDIMVRRWELEDRINTAYQAGRITSKQVCRLQADMDATIAQENAFRASGGISLKEGRTLYSDYDRIASKLEECQSKVSKR